MLGNRQHFFLGQPAEGDTVFEGNHDTLSDFMSSNRERARGMNSGSAERHGPPVRLRTVVYLSS
jgi:hypothetical protein